jgi:hypothetical protein
MPFICQQQGSLDAVLSGAPGAVEACGGIAGPLSQVDVAVLLEHALDWDAERELHGRLGAPVPRADLVLDAGPAALRFETVIGRCCRLARDPREQAEFEIVSLSRFLEFQPVRRVQQEYLRTRVEERRGTASVTSPRRRRAAS